VRALGAKAGLLANSLLGKDYFKTTAIVVTKPSPPTSCFVEGVQFVTGCTMGKRNIRLRKGKNTSVVFLREGKRVRLRVKDEVLDSINKIASEAEPNRESARLLDSPTSELFEVEK
jgi:formylmethanofuran dehydrogenase subunit E